MSADVTTASVATPVTPRPAATLLVLREGALGTEVLMGRRAAGHRFMPNSLVFPGGAVDAEDHHGSVATSFSTYVTNLLMKGADASLTHALGVALARELEEETGLTLGRPPALADIDYLCRAITPSIRPKRFDARFFVVSASHVHGTIASSQELEDVRYFPLAEVRALDLEFATHGALVQVTAWLALSDGQRRGRATVPVMREKVWQDA